MSHALALGLLGGDVNKYLSYTSVCQAILNSYPCMQNNFIRYYLHAASRKFAFRGRDKPIALHVLEILPQGRGWPLGHQDSHQRSLTTRLEMILDVVEMMHYDMTQLNDCFALRRGIALYLGGRREHASLYHGISSGRHCQRIHRFNKKI